MDGVEFPQGWNEAPVAMMDRVITSTIKIDITRMRERIV